MTTEAEKRFAEALDKQGIQYIHPAEQENATLRARLAAAEAEAARLREALDTVSEWWVRKSDSEPWLVVYRTLAQVKAEFTDVHYQILLVSDRPIYRALSASPEAGTGEGV